MKVHYATYMLTLAIAAALIGPAQAQPAPVTVKALGSIPYPLEQLAPSGGAVLADGVLTLSAVKGTDLYANTDGSKLLDNTPRVLFAPQGDFIFSARVTAAFRQEFDGGALIVYSDKANWAKLLFERSKDGKAAIATTVTKGAGDDALHQTIEGETVHLKIARRGALYVFYASADGVTWRMLRTFGFAGSDAAGAPVRIGFSAQSPVGTAFSARFSELRFRAQAFSNYWQGE